MTQNHQVKLDSIKFTITGTAPLLMHSGKITPNPLHPLTKLIREYTGKKYKTSEDHLIISALEWYASLYLDDSIERSVNISGSKIEFQGGKIIVPRENILAMLTKGAVFQKKQEQFKMGVFCLEDPQLIFPDQDKSLQEIWDSKQYLDTRTARVKGKTVMRSRPVFEEWQLDFTINYAASIVNKEDVLKAIENASVFVGMLDYAPRFGSFAVAVKVSES